MVIIHLLNSSAEQLMFLMCTETFCHKSVEKQDMQGQTLIFNLLE